MEGASKFHQNLKGVHGRKKFKSPCFRRIPDQETNQVFPMRRRSASPSTAMFSDGRIKAATNKTKHSCLLAGRCRSERSIFCVTSVSHSTATNVMFQFTGWRVNCHRSMLNFAYSCLDHYREQLLTKTGAYEIAKQDSWIPYFGNFYFSRLSMLSPQNLIDCVYFCKK